MKIKVNLDPEYSIEIKKGLIKENWLPEGFVITDSNIEREYGNFIGEYKYVIKAGEESKTFKNAGKIISKLKEIDAKMIIAFGGGVVGDLAGFAASTCNRGVDLIHIPTSLLSMVDSSIGGKTAVNIGKIKNCAGTFYQPKKVLIDPLLLETLPDEEFRNGTAEIIKYSYLFEKPSLERLKKGVFKNDEDLEQIIYQCCQAKSRIIENDEKDKNCRHALNFGHTIGHAIELLYGLKHGEAVSIGMVKELELGEKIFLVKKEAVAGVKEALKANSLPLNFPDNFDTAKVLEIMKYDKKGECVFAFDKNNYEVKVDESIVKSFLDKE